jgi:hypothetical protein
LRLARRNAPSTLTPIMMSADAAIIRSENDIDVIADH